MGLASFVKIFMPKDRVFYGLFEEVANNLKEMSALFKAALQENDASKRGAMLKGLEEWEHKNDVVTHRLFVELGRNFITPFDREDIHYLATALDDVADYMWGSAKRMMNYNMDEVDEITQEFGQIIGKAVEYLYTGIHELRNMRDLRAITEVCVNVNSLENEGDDLLDKGMMALFTSSIEPIEVIKKKDLYQMLELVTDKCEDAANVIESIIIKYA